MRSLFRVVVLLIPEVLKMRAGKAIALAIAALVIALSLLSGDHLATVGNEQDLINFMDQVVNSCNQTRSGPLNNGGDQVAPD